ncbi:MAG: methyltransferase domain-containing protein [Acidobacteriota bacterium]|nr:methyltransferase domain-containing protein [Acidobacteriota bacterium]
MLTPTRTPAHELLDEHDAPQADMERSLRDLRWINKYWGGVAIYRSLVRRFAPRSILDLGAGTADLLDSVAHVPLRIALDFKIDHLLYERHRSRALRVVGDATRLPFRDNAVELITSAHFFHHFSPEENIGILKEALRVTSKGVAVNDTRRHYAPLAFILLVSALRIVGRITRYDGPASVRQGYTIAEARGIAGQTGAKWAVVRKFPFRLAILLWK